MRGGGWLAIKRHTWWLVVGVAIAVALGVGYLWLPKERPAAGQFAIGGQGEPLPSTCDRELVEQLVPRVIKAINDVDRVELAKFFGDDLLWYSAGKDERFIKAVTLTDLTKYLAQRRQRQERTELVGLTYTGGSGSLRVAWAMKLRISANDLPISPMEVAGKAEASCSTHRIIVWSVGSEA